MIACSLLEDRWLGEIDAVRPVLFVAAGVFYYLREGQLKGLFGKLADVFPGAEVLFDACSPRGLRMANRKVIKAGGMDESAALTWALRRPKDLESWDPRFAVLEEYPIFRGVKEGLTAAGRYGTWVSDALKIMSMVHVRLG